MMTRTSRGAGLCALAAALLAGCAEPSDAERGGKLFSEVSAGPSGLNFYACATCHEQSPSGTSRRWPGAAVAGAIDRPSFWGGQEDDLLRSINACRTYFMYARGPLSADEPDAVALYAFLSELAPSDPNPAPFTVIRQVEDVPRGNAESGKLLYTDACASCHGSMHDGAGNLSKSRVPILPEETLEEHKDLTPRTQRLVFIEKTRHGGFLGYGGAMPPLSKEVLSDGELADILEALGLLGI